MATAAAAPAATTTTSFVIRDVATCTPEQAMTVAQMDWNEWRDLCIENGLTSLEKVFEATYGDNMSANERAFAAMETTITTFAASEEQAQEQEERQVHKTDGASTSTSTSTAKRVVEKTEDILGIIRLAQDDLRGHNDEFRPWIASLLVTEKARGKGVARMLIEHVVREYYCAQQTGGGDNVRPLHLWCDIGKSPFLQKFYESVGFAVVKVVDMPALGYNPKFYSNQIAIMRYSK